MPNIYKVFYLFLTLINGVTIHYDFEVLLLFSPRLPVYWKLVSSLAGISIYKNDKNKTKQKTADERITIFVVVKSFL